MCVFSDAFVPLKNTKFNGDYLNKWFPLPYKFIPLLYECYSKPSLHKEIQKRSHR